MQTSRTVHSLSGGVLSGRVFQPLCKLLAILCLWSFGVWLTQAQTYSGMLTWHNDLARTGRNLLKQS